MSELKLCINCRFYGQTVVGTGDQAHDEGVCRAAHELALVNPVTGGLLVGMVAPCAAMRRGGHCGLEGALYQPAFEEISE